MLRRIKNAFILSALLAPSVVFATASDIVPTSPPSTNVTVSKICISSLTMDVKSHVAIINYQRCSSPGNYLGTEVVTLTVTDQGATLVQPYTANVTTAAVNWTTVTTDLSGVAAAVKTLTTRVLSGS